MTHERATVDLKALKTTTAVARFIVVFDPKGGSGKTTVARGAAYALMQSGQPFTVIDSDNENPDLFKEHAVWRDDAKAFAKRRESIEVLSLELKTETQFIEFGNVLENIPGTVLLNTAAGSGRGLLKHWRDIFEAVETSNRRLTILYPIDRGRDTLESLRDFVDAVVDDKLHPDRRVVVLRNLFFGEVRRFIRFNAWEQAHRPSTMLVENYPELNEIVIDKLVDQRATLDGTETLTKMERSALKAYQATVMSLMRTIGVVDA